MADFKYVELNGITYQVRADRPLPWWAKGAKDVAPAREEPPAKEAAAPANKSRRSPRSKQVSADG